MIKNVSRTIVQSTYKSKATKPKFNSHYNNYKFGKKRKRAFGEW